MSKHYEKEFKVRDKTFKCKKLNPFEFKAFQTTFGMALNTQDTKALAAGYQNMMEWLTYEVTPGNFVPVMQSNGSFILPALNDLGYADEVINAMLVEVITPLFQSSVDSK